MHNNQRMTASDFDQGLLNEFDHYVHGRIDRRQFLDRAAKYATGGVTAAALVDMLLPNYALATQVDEKDPRIKAEMITFSSPKGNGDTKGYLVRPASGGKRGGVVVVHENRGLNPYIADVARRLAAAGFIALAPDGLSSLGGYPGDDEKGRDMQAKLQASALTQDFVAAFGRLKSEPDINGKVGAVGFCFGGTVVNAMAVMLPDLAAAAPYYGRQPKAEEVPSIKAPLLIHYGALDEPVTSGWPPFESALKEHKKDYAAFIYPNANHGFHNDTTPRYDKAAAELSWDRTIAFFNKHLS